MDGRPAQYSFPLNHFTFYSDSAHRQNALINWDKTHQAVGTEIDWYNQPTHICIEILPVLAEPEEFQSMYGCLYPVCMLRKQAKQNKDLLLYHLFVKKEKSTTYTMPDPQ